MNFVKIFLPFFIIRISPYSPHETLIWVGVIMGVPSLISAVTSTLWGSLTSRLSPKLLFLRGLFCHSVLFFLMGFTSSLHILLMLRILQGVMGGVSTVGLIIVSFSSSIEKISVDIGFFQSSITLGQLVGPPIGALMAIILGYKGSFVCASAILFISLILCHFFVKGIPLQQKEEKFFGPTTINSRTIIMWMLCFTATVQLMFLPSVLPNVLKQFNFEQTIALKWAGLVVMFYSATAMIGTYVWSRLSKKVGLYRMITYLIAFGISSNRCLP